ncbi:MAG: NAD(P)H-dependent oxidoreductase subunit E [Acidimicrobiaceae bacterium]|nr:NAD(P)H-dependent oxidoreductase subunit E [Acidimicrobiaceae bacterium]
MTDIHLGAERASEPEIAAVDAALRAAGADPVVIRETERLYTSGNARRRRRRHFLLPALHALQNTSGWISPGGINYVAEVLDVPPAEAFGVAGFYDLFRTEAPCCQDDTFHVCVDSPCRISGADDLAAQLRAEGKQVRQGPCLGQCERAPALFVQGAGGRPDHVPADGTVARVDPESRSGRCLASDRVPADGASDSVAREAAEGASGNADAGARRGGLFELPQAGDASLRLLRRVGVADPRSLDSYLACGGFTALRRAAELGAEAVLEQVAASGLSGRGGAAFPTGVKWRAVADETASRKHLVANCDESEPGAFKDRILMERDPFALVESMTIAALATGATHGWIYIRGEYPLAAARLRSAIDAARDAGLLGLDAAGTGRRFDIAVWRGAGAYICGEETALFNSLEGFRGEPRNKPPYPTSHGLFGEPTAVNNPETLLNVLDIVNDGPDAYRSRGTDTSPGTKLFCVSGRVGRAGLYEAPFGITLGELLDLAGGVTGSGELRAVLMGGAAGSFVGPESLSLPLTLEDARAAGATLGAGVVMIFDTSVDMADVVVRIAEFFRHESCGQCVPCRVGAVRQHETLLQMQQRGSLSPQRRALIDDIAEAMVDASICGLGHTAASAVRSALDLGLIASAPLP